MQLLHGSDYNTYEINGHSYRPIENPDSNTTPYVEYYAWYVDRGFFHSYGSTSDGYTVYGCARLDSFEVLILEKDGEEVLLALTDSVLHRPEAYSIEDFGLVRFEDNILAEAKDFDWLFYAHTQEKNAVETKEDVYNGSGSSEGLTVDAESLWEYVRIPGLSYYFYIVDGEQMYVYYRSGDYMVEIESKGRYDCIREAYENTYGKYYGNNK